MHHGKHHAAYVKNLNKALAPHPKTIRSLWTICCGHLDLLPRDIFTTVRNNGGGHANHSLFWQCLSPKGSGNAPR
jgi:Fe-Mn family superoxide dismutase